MTTPDILKQNYIDICNKVSTAAIKANRKPEDIKVLAVSKTHNYTIIADAIKAGIPIFAESYAQEFRDKYKDLSTHTDLATNCEFHFIGHLQSNKAKYLVPFVTTIHTIDSINLAKEINKQAEKINKKINVLIQVNTSGEDAKSGIQPEHCIALIKEILPLSNLNLVGLMTIGTFSENEILIRKEFSLLRNCLTDINTSIGLTLKELSMGMSHDFEIAIQEQATMIRIGTAIFGNRK